MSGENHATFVTPLPLLLRGGLPETLGDPTPEVAARPWGVRTVCDQVAQTSPQVVTVPFLEVSEQTIGIGKPGPAFGRQGVHARLVSKETGHRLRELVAKVLVVTLVS